jgi:hypothetical protein
MQPGVAANPDSVRIAMEGERRVRADLLALEQDESREWSRFLTPVQVARLSMIRQRVIDRANVIRQGRQGGGGGRLGPNRPNQRPRGRPLGPRERR